MIMKLIKNIFIIALLAFISAGCEDFLERNSKSEFVPKDATPLNELLLAAAYLRNAMIGFEHVQDDGKSKFRTHKHV